MKARSFCLAWLLGGAAHAQGPPPPPPAAGAERLPDSVALPGARTPETAPEAGAVKVQVHGEYELRQSALTAYRLTPVAGGPAHLDQPARLFHWLRLRPLALFGERAELRAQADVPRGMIYGTEPVAVPDSGTDFERRRPLRVQPRMLRATLRGGAGELTLGHTTTHFGMGLLDNDGDQPRWFGIPERPATFERLELKSGAPDAQLRVGVAGDLLFEDGPLSLADGDRLWRVSLNARYAPSRRAGLDVLARYQTLRPRGERGGAQLFTLDASGELRTRLPGRDGELFGQWEAIYQVGAVDEPSPFASTDGARALAALAAAARAGVALERRGGARRYAHLVVSLGWGMTSGDADPTDDELHRFVMNPNHGVGLLLFSELLRFKTSRAQALLASEDAAEGRARVFGLATRGGVAGAAYLNPVVLVRPSPELALKLGAVVATATTNVVDPASVAGTGARSNFDGGSPLGRSLGTELDVGAELATALNASLQLRLSIEAGVAFPGSAFTAADGSGLGTQAVSTAGLGLSF